VIDERTLIVPAARVLRNGQQDDIAGWWDWLTLRANVFLEITTTAPVIDCTPSTLSSRVPSIVRRRDQTLVDDLRRLRACERRP